MWGEKLPENINSLMSGISAILGIPASDVCRLETTCEDMLVQKDKSLGTVLKISGTLAQMGVEDISEAAERIAHTLTSALNSSGVYFQVIFHSDPSGVGRYLEHVSDPSVKTASMLFGPSAKDFFDDWMNSVGNYCCEETVFIVVWTRTINMVPSERKKATKAMTKRQNAHTYNNSVQFTELAIPELISTHQGHVGLLEDALKYNDILSERMSIHDVMWTIRHQMDSAWTGYDWKARLPGDGLSFNLSETPKDDLGDLFYPKLSKQLLPREAEDWDKRALQVGDTLFSTMNLELSQQPPIRIFNVLFRSLMPQKMPYRVSFLIGSGGVQGLAMKEILSSVLFITSSQNRRFTKALKELRDFQEDGGAVVTLQASFATWVNLLDQSTDVPRKVALQRSRAKLQAQASQLAAAVQGWGGCDVNDVVGDQLATLASTVPGLTTKYTGNASIAPMSDVAMMLPLYRPAWPWNKGSLILRTPDGKVMPYQVGSSKQAAWIDLGIAPMGGGKSVLLNTYNWAFLTQAGLTRLPWLSIIDVGPSSKGLIDMLTTLLPEGSKHLALYRRLRMDANDAINPFDTPLGCRNPLPNHVAFLTNFLSLLATPLDALSPYDGVSGLAQAAVVAAYEELSPDNHPRIFNEMQAPDIAEKARRSGISTDDNTTWWELVDSFFEKDMIHEAVQAQRFAVPMLSDVATAARNPVVAQMYDLETPMGEKLVDFFSRALMESINAYPVLRTVTQLDLGDAQIVSLDLDEVTPRGGASADRQAGVMYMLARQVAAGHFFLMPEDVRGMPSLYKAYHAKRISTIRTDPKRLSMDELHRVARSGPLFEQIVADIETSARESRKWNLHIGLYSQSIQDFPEVIINELVTSMFVLGGGSPKANKRVAEMLNLPDALRTRLENLGKPDKRGANMVGVFKTSEGQVSHLLTNTIGQRMIWAFSSSAEDVYVRGFLYQKIGVSATLDILVSLYPGGIKEEVEKRRSTLRSSDDELEAVDTLDEIVGEVLELHKKRTA